MIRTGNDVGVAKYLGRNPDVDTNLAESHRHDSEEVREAAPSVSERAHDGGAKPTRALRWRATSNEEPSETRLGKE